MRWKWIVGIAAAVCVVLLVVAYIIAVSYDYNTLKPLITKTVKDFTGRDLTLGGDIDLGIGLPPTLEVNDIAFQNAPWGSQPQMARFKKLQVQVSILPLIRGNIDVNRLILIEPVVFFEVNKSGESNLEFEVPQKAKTPKPEKKTDEKGRSLFKFEEVTINDGKINYKDHRTGRTETVELESLDFESPLFGEAADIELKGNYNKTPFKVNGHIGQLSGILNPQEKWPLKLEAQAVETTVSIDGDIQDPLSARGIDLKLNIEGKDLAQFEKFTGEPFPAKGPFRLSGHFKSPSKDTVQVSDLLVVLGESQIQGTVHVTHAAKRPQIEAKLTSKQLDLRPMMADNGATEGTPEQPAGAGSKKDKVFPNTPLQLDALHTVDALVQLTATRILTPHLAFDDFLLDLSLKDGVLNIKQLNAGEEKGGKLAGSIEMDARKAGTRMNLELDIKDLDLGNMAKKLGVSDAVAGKLNLNLDLRGQGNSVAAIMAGLNGDSKILMSDGKINSRYAEVIFGDLRASLTKLFNPLAEKEEYATLNCVVNHFEIKDGLAESQVLVIDTNRMTVIGEGDINLKTEALDMGVTPEPKEGLGAGNVATVNVSLSEFSKPFRLQGTLANPSLGIDPTKTVLTFGKALGGIALFGPAGLATTFVSGKFGQNHPCTQSLAALGDKEKAAKKKESGGIGSKIKSLFSKPKD
jgi:uncharacterized protein involved in outer membrane biogenesis